MYLFPKALHDLAILFPFSANMKFYDDLLISNNAERNLVRFLLFRVTFNP